MYFFAPIKQNDLCPIVGMKAKVVVDTTQHMPPSKIATAEVIEVSGDICRIRFLEIAENCGVAGEDPSSAKYFQPDLGSQDTFVIPMSYFWAKCI